MQERPEGQSDRGVHTFAGERAVKSPVCFQQFLPAPGMAENQAVHAVISGKSALSAHALIPEEGRAVQDIREGIGPLSHFHIPIWPQKGKGEAFGPAGHPAQPGHKFAVPVAVKSAAFSSASGVFACPGRFLRLSGRLPRFSAFLTTLFGSRSIGLATVLKGQDVARRGQNGRIREMDDLGRGFLTAGLQQDELSFEGTIRTAVECKTQPLTGTRAPPEVDDHAPGGKRLQNNAAVQENAHEGHNGAISALGCQGGSQPGLLKKFTGLIRRAETKLGGLHVLWEQSMSRSQHGHSFSWHLLLVKGNGAHAGESFFGRALTGAAPRHAAQKQGEIGAAGPGRQDVSGKAISKRRGKFRHTAFQVGISSHFRERLRVYETDDHDAHAEEVQRGRNGGLHCGRRLGKKLAHPLGPVSHPRIELLLGKEACGGIH